MHGHLLPEQVQPIQIRHTRLVQLGHGKQARVIPQVGQVIALNTQVHQRINDILESQIATGASRLEELRQHIAYEGNLCLNGCCYHRSCL